MRTVPYADVSALSSASVETGSINGGVTGEKVVTGNARDTGCLPFCHCISRSGTCFVSVPL